VCSSRGIKAGNKDKPPLVNQQCVVYWFKCDLCDAGYVSYICQHQQIEEHNDRESGHHLREKNDKKLGDVEQSFTILR